MGFLSGPAALSYPIANQTEQINGSGLSIAAADTQPLTWDNHVNGATLLDRSTANAPKILVSGIYSVMVSLTPTSGLSVGANYEAVLALSAGGVGIPRPGGDASAPPATSIVNIMRLFLAGSCYIGAGDTISVTVLNNDSGSKTFEIAGAYISRLLPQ